MHIFLKTKGQLFIEKTLCVSAFVIGVAYCVCISFQYVYDYLKAISVLQWAGLCLLIVSLAYLIISLLASEESRKRIIAFLKRVCSFEQVLLIMMLIWFVLSLYVNQVKQGTPFLKLGDRYLFDFAVCALLLFPLSKALDSEHRRRALNILLHIVALSYSVFTIFCLWHVFQLHELVLPSGELVGLTRYYQLVLGYHYNTTGMIAATMLCICIYMTVTYKKEVRVLYIILSIVHLIVVYLSNSRTVFVGVLVFVLCGSFFAAWDSFPKKAAWKRILISLALAAVGGLLFWAGRSQMFNIFENITHFGELVAAETVSATNHTRMYSPVALSVNGIYQSGQVINANINDVVRPINDLSHRDEIWISALRVLGSNGFVSWFGVTPFSVTRSLMEVGFYPETAAHAHNSVLQVGMVMGVPGMTIFVIFIITICSRGIQSLLVPSNHCNVAKTICFAAIICFLVIGMAEAYLVAYFSSISCIFFLFCGFMVERDEVGAVSFYEKSKSKNIWKYRLIIMVPVISIMIAAVCFSANYLNVNPARISGTGSLLDPYLIKNKRDMIYFRNLVNMGNKFENRYFKQTDDVELDGIKWKSIGRYHTDKYFAGIYEANYHTVTNFVLEQNSSLFENMKGQVRRLLVRNCYVNGNSIDTLLSDSNNLLLGTNHGAMNYYMSDNGYNATLEEDEEGIVVKSRTYNNSLDGGNGYLVLLYEDERSRWILSGKKGDVYTLSFDAMANIDDAMIEIRHSGLGKKNTQIDFGAVYVNQPNEWNHVVLTGELTGEAPNSQGVFIDLRNNPAGTEIRIKNLQLEKGETASKWKYAREDVISMSGLVF